MRPVVLKMLREISDIVSEPRFEYATFRNMKFRVIDDENYIKY